MNNKERRMLSAMIIIIPIITLSLIKDVGWLAAIFYVLMVTCSIVFTWRED